MAQQPPPDASSGDLPPPEHDDQILDQSTESPKATQKVALDLDDAPFLNQSAPEEEQVPPEAEKSEPPQPAKPPSPRKKEDTSSRKLIYILGASIMILLIGVVIFWLTRPSAPPEQVVVEQPPPPAPEPKTVEHFVEFDPFWVSYEQDDKVLFLSIRIALVTEDPTLSLEVQRKTIILRDAAYYFLNNRPLPSVKREEAADVLKQDLLSVFNQHLSRPLTGVLIEEYLVR